MVIELGQRVKNEENGQTIFGKVTKVSKEKNEFAVQWEGKDSYSVYRMRSIGKTVYLA